MSEIAGFLLARIAEDEAAANYANNGGRWESWNRSWDTEPLRDIAANGVRLFAVSTMYDEHIARHDPARILAECEAKRRIVERCSFAEKHPDWAGNMDVEDVWEHAMDDLHDLATVYADHPDYQEAWRP